MKPWASTARSASAASLSALVRVGSLTVTDRRWAAPLSALALGFGLFIGVAIGPASEGTLASGVSQIVVPGTEHAASAGRNGEGGPAAADVSPGGSGGDDGSGSIAPSPSAPPPVEPPPSSPPPPAPAPAPAPPDSRGDDQERPPDPQESTLTGTVLHANPAAGSYTLADDENLYAIHAKRLPAPGTELSVAYRQLANGTHAEDAKRKQSGRSTSATFSGVVTFVDPDPADPAYTVSRRGVSVLVHVDPDPAGALPALPAPGDFVIVSAEIGEPPADPPQDDPSADPVPAPLASQTCLRDASLPPAPDTEPTAILRQRGLETDGEPFDYSDFAGVVQAICPETGELVISADDVREAGQDLVLQVPEGIDLSLVAPDESVAATATIGPDGSLALEGLASDEGTDGADEPDLTQGDLDAG